MLFLVHNRGVSERERERRRSENADKIRLVHRASIPNCFFSSASNTQCSDNFFSFLLLFHRLHCWHPSLYIKQRKGNSFEQFSFSYRRAVYVAWWGSEKNNFSAKQIFFSCFIWISLLYKYSHWVSSYSNKATFVRWFEVQAFSPFFSSTHTLFHPLNHQPEHNHSISFILFSCGGSNF